MLFLMVKRHNNKIQYTCLDNKPPPQKKTKKKKNGNSVIIYLALYLWKLRWSPQNSFGRFQT